MLLRYAILLVLLAGCGTSSEEGPLNVFVILVDDLGWIDTGVYGSSYYLTPNIDRLSAEGVRFSQFYSSGAVCSPTRASLMTGKSPARLHLTNWIGGEQSGLLRQADYIRALPLEETTVAEAFKDAGYATGYIGKWHLGGEGFMPEDQGFGYTRAVNFAGHPGSYYPPYENPQFTPSNVPDLIGDPDDAYLTDRLTDFALDFIAARQDSAFFLVLSHYAVHTPLQSKADLQRQFEERAPKETTGPAFLPEKTFGMTKQRQDHAVYAGMVASMDESVGRVLEALRSLDLEANTIVAFVSDNGGLSTLMGQRTWAPTSNLPLRAGKGWLYEGGIRIPFILRAPSFGSPGQVVDAPGITTDLYPTLLALAGLPPREDQHVDGIDLSSALSRAEPRALHWHCPHYHGSGNRPSGAIRSDGFKLVEWFEDGNAELYDLKGDPGETRDLSATMPEKAAELRTSLHRWRAASDAYMPTPNPDWVITAQPGDS